MPGNLLLTIMRYITGFGLVLSGVNLLLFLFLVARAWKLCTFPFDCEAYPGPHTFSEQTLSLQLGLLQATLVGIGVGLTILGVFGFRTIQGAAEKEAKEAADTVARETAETVAKEVADTVARETTEELVKTLFPPSLSDDGRGPTESDSSELDEPNPFTLRPRS